MYYAFNAFTGRLIGASHARSFAPQGLRVLMRAAAAAAAANTTTTTSIVNRNVATSEIDSNVNKKIKQETTLSEKMKRLQEHFQKDDGLPVYLKGGPMDKVLYATAITLCTIGMTIVVYEFSKIA